MRPATDCLGPDSSVAAALPGFAPREEQIRMAEAVEEAFAEGRHLLVEAGTGVGKSFAYLVPALLHAAENQAVVLVSTRTIALQEQLVERDLPLLRRALGLEDLPVALAKGRSNYVCRRRLQMAVEEEGLFEDPRHAEELARVVKWARTTEDGSLADLPFRPRAEVWSVACAESGNCLHQNCRFFKSCAYQRSRRRMYRAKLIVANHALVFADLALRDQGVQVLPDYDALVLDEAHEVEDGAASHFGARLSVLGIARQLGRFMGRRRRAGLFERVEVGKELYDAHQEVRESLTAMFADVTRVRGGDGERRLKKPGEFLDPLTLPLRALVRKLREHGDDIRDPGLALEWRARTEGLEQSCAAVELVHGMLDPDLVYWVEGAAHGRSVLRAAPREVASLLRRTLFRRTRSVVLTSATLRVGGSFAHLRRRLGLEEPDELGLGSPFDFARQCTLELHPGMPDPRDEGWEPAVHERTRELVLESGGGAFVLFTAYRALDAAYRALAPDLRKAGLRVLRQGDQSTRAIVDAFRTHRDCVLFATDTFWQGIDVRGDHLRLVVVTRLPFAVPTHPLQQARAERIEEDGGDAFRELSLPQAVLKLRQGFGRLIRAHDDRGKVAILDPRILTKRYGRTFLQSLPDCRVEKRAERPPE